MNERLYRTGLTIALALTVLMLVVGILMYGSVTADEQPRVVNETIVPTSDGNYVPAVTVARNVSRPGVTHDGLDAPLLGDSEQTRNVTRIVPLGIYDSHGEAEAAVESYKNGLQEPDRWELAVAISPLLTFPASLFLHSRLTSLSERGDSDDGR